MIRRKPYRKPQVNQIKLVPEDAVLMACKADAVGAARSRTGCTKSNDMCANAGS